MNYFLKLEWVDYNPILKFNRPNTINEYALAKEIVKILSYGNKPYVAIINGYDSKYKYEREFLNGEMHQSYCYEGDSNRSYLIYILSEGKIYEIKQFIGRGQYNKFFCIIDDLGELIKVNEAHVCKLLNQKNI